MTSPTIFESSVTMEEDGRIDVKVEEGALKQVKFDKQIVDDLSQTNKSESELQVEVVVIDSKLKLGLVILGLILSIFVAALDETIVATALGSISNQFNASGQVTWIIGSYLLTTTAFQPLYGKFSDLFGRKVVLGFALTTFLLGSIGCGLANTVLVLIVFRGVAGVGGGGLIALSFIIISDSVPIAKRSAYMSLINLTFGFANVIAPLLGGILVDNLSWRWIFYLNIPIVLVTMLVTLGFVPLVRGTGNFRYSLGRVDLLGTLTLVISIGCTVLGLNWGGKEYPWKSIPVLFSLALGLIFLLAFVWVELKVAVEPILPARIFTTNLILTNATTSCAGALLFVVLNYWPLYHQTLHEASATGAGIEVIPFLVGLCGFAVISGILCSKYGTYRGLMRTGMFFTLVGSCLMFRLSSTWYRWEQFIYVFSIGIGVGLNVQICVISCQAAVSKKDAAIVTALSSFSISLGGVLGLAIQGAIFQNFLRYQLSTTLPNQDIDLITQSLQFTQLLSPSEQELVKSAYIIAYRWLFVSTVPYSLVGFICTLFLKHIPL